MTTPTHEEISHHAHQLWQEYGRPADRDTEIWHTAERQLTAKAANAHADHATPDSAPRKNLHPVPASRSTAVFAERTESETEAGSAVDHPNPSPIPDEEAGKVARQKHDARAPQIPHHTGPTAKPPESGKPLWNKPHSS